ncbi:hypothetical protein DB891_00405 [Flavobacterium laiguense]|uniref:Uncharacterized protein n=1 Tax=Flavobacterium laiguense TaxID=2169409 RepID=A0A2U1K2Y6_9FLAO|nr:hypothetical protein DB891_00405 [Flavobacterium laiguense]
MVVRNRFFIFIGRKILHGDFNYNFKSSFDFKKLSLFKLILDCKDSGLSSNFKGFGLDLLIVINNKNYSRNCIFKGYAHY